MIPLSNPLYLSFPCFYISSKEELRLEGEHIVAKNIKLPLGDLLRSEKPISGKPIMNYKELFTMGVSRDFNYILDYQNNIIYLLNKQCQFSIVSSTIELITENFIFVSKYSFPIDHYKSTELREEAINTVMLIAKLAIWNNIPFYIGLTNEHIRAKSRSL